MATDPPLNIFNRRGDREALVVTHHPDSGSSDNAALAVWNNAESGSGPGALIVKKGTGGAAIDARGDGDLLILRDSAGTPKLTVAQNGTMTPAGGTTITFADGHITTGDITLTNVGATWTIISALSVTIAAVAGDRVEYRPSFLWNVNGSDFLDLAVIDGTTIRRYASTGTGSPTAAGEGDPALYPTSGFPGHGVQFTVPSLAANEVSGGVVTFAVVFRGIGGSKVFASNNYPFRYTIHNYGH